VVNVKTPATRTRVLLADDHPAMREGLVSMLARENMDVIAQAADGTEAVRLFDEHRPDLTLMDLQMPLQDGLAATKAILQKYPNALIVVLTSYEGDVRVSRALGAGARSYILKTSSPKEFGDAIRRVLRGDVIVVPPVLAAASRGEDHLTAREISVVKLIAHGVLNRDIGKSLNVSEHTIKARIKSILSKLGANDRSHAVTVARERGYLDP
jgi:DNA-binding NarL/FixJ family response regulator